MAKVRQSKGASGSTTASVTFSADAGGRWDINFVRGKSDLSSAVMLFKQGTTTVGTVTVGTTATVLPSAGNGPVFVGASEAAVTVSVDGTSACEIMATASLDEEGAA